MSLSQAFLDELRARTSLTSLIEKTVKLTKAGREKKGCCPFHNEKTASFYVNDDKGFYHCFGCSAHGDAIRWMTDQRGMPFMDAVKELADAAGMEVPARSPEAAARDQERDVDLEIMSRVAGAYQRQLTGYAEATAYLEARGITRDQARTFGIGYASGKNGWTIPEIIRDSRSERLERLGLIRKRDDGSAYDFFRDRLMIPIYDGRGRVIAFGGRIMGKGEPKYLNSPDTPVFDKGRTLFNLHRASGPARQSGRLVIVEGYMDVLALDRAGIIEAVAPNGTALTEAQIGLAWRLVDEPIVCLDGDRAGRAAAARAAARALPILQPGKSLRFASPPDGLDPDDLIAQRGAAALGAVLADARPMSEVLWQHELDAQPVDTPEQWSGLRRRLVDLCNTIRDRDVAAAYGQFFAGKMSERFGAGEQRERMRKRTSALIRTRVGAQIELGILEGMLRTPDVVGEQMEALVSSRWQSEKFGAVVDLVIDRVVAKPSIDTDGLLSAIEVAGMGDYVRAARAALRLPFPWTDGRTAPAAAREALIEAIAVRRPR